MRFYVSGPVVDEVDKRDVLGRVYLTIERVLKGHDVSLPLRSRDLDGLAPVEFVKTIDGLIGSSNAVITVLVDNDQSGPVEATIASHRLKPQCMMDMSAGAARLLRGLPQVTEVARITPQDLEAQVTQAVERFLKVLTLRQ
jgi:hypothetical protein